MHKYMYLTRVRYWPFTKNTDNNTPLYILSITSKLVTVEKCDIYRSLSAMLMTRRVAHEMMYLTMSLWLYLQAKCSAVCPFLFTDCNEYPCSCSARNCKRKSDESIKIEKRKEMSVC